MKILAFIFSLFAHSLFYFNYGTNFKCRWSKWFPADETLGVIDLEVEELVLGGSGKPYVFLTEEIARRRQGANMKREDRLGTIKNLPRIIEARTEVLTAIKILIGAIPLAMFFLCVWKYGPALFSYFRRKFFQNRSVKDDAESPLMEVDQENPEDSSESSCSSLTSFSDYKSQRLTVNSTESCEPRLQRNENINQSNTVCQEQTHESPSRFSKQSSTDYNLSNSGSQPSSSNESQNETFSNYTLIKSRNSSGDGLTHGRINSRDENSQYPSDDVLKFDLLRLPSDCGFRRSPSKMRRLPEKSLSEEISPHRLPVPHPNFPSSPVSAVQPQQLIVPPLSENNSCAEQNSPGSQKSSSSDSYKTACSHVSSCSHLSITHSTLPPKPEVLVCLPRQSSGRKPPEKTNVSDANSDLVCVHGRCLCCCEICVDVNKTQVDYVMLGRHCKYTRMVKHANRLARLTRAVAPQQSEYKRMLKFYELIRDNEDYFYPPPDDADNSRLDVHPNKLPRGVSADHLSKGGILYSIFIPGPES